MNNYGVTTKYGEVTDCRLAQSVFGESGFISACFQVQLQMAIV